MNKQQINDGGPAFPRTVTINDGIDGFTERKNNGMTLQTLADGLTVNDKPAEGMVVRPCKGGAMGSGRPLGFKIINRNYKDQ